ncbi:MAG: cyclic nucleotide-binding domain-containing protein [Deltaproteobacteria bacterium]|nr:MAG: cyclic nucleotide-binding domain-containing protein [Deltaproteobacteria bacterium]
MAIDVDILSKVSFFKNLTTEELQSLADVMDVKPLQKGEMIFKLGDIGDSLYIVKSGTVELYVRDHTGEKLL